LAVVRELPRIPFAPEFRPFAKAGEKLAKLHFGGGVGDRSVSGVGR
jgi:hypothetical protein